MAKKKPKKADRKKEDFPARIDLAFREPLIRLRERRRTLLSVEINRAVRELLEREGLWPPKADAEDLPS